MDFDICSPSSHSPLWVASATAISSIPQIVFSFSPLTPPLFLPSSPINPPQTHLNSHPSHTFYQTRYKPNPNSATSLHKHKQPLTSLPYPQKNPTQQTGPRGSFNPPPGCQNQRHACMNCRREACSDPVSYCYRYSGTAVGGTGL